MASTSMRGVNDLLIQVDNQIKQTRDIASKIIIDDKVYGDKKTIEEKSKELREKLDFDYTLSELVNEALKVTRRKYYEQGRYSAGANDY